MSKQEYKNKVAKYVKEDSEGRVFIDEKALLKDRAGKKVDDDVGVTEKEMAEFSIKVNIDPYTAFPDRLPTDGKLPRPVDEHVKMGLYESKRDLYLTIANAYNKAMEKIEALEDRIRVLENS